jgi:hypothetical protein
VTGPALDAEAFTARFGSPLTEIGKVVSGDSVSFLENGKPAEVGRGHDHFRRT